MKNIKAPRENKSAVDPKLDGWTTLTLVDGKGPELELDLFWPRYWLGLKIPAKGNTKNVTENAAH